MNVSELRKLNFRRQYIIAPGAVKCPFESKTIRLTDGYRIYAHIDLRITMYEQGGLKIILLGDIFDFEVPRKNNSDILKELMIWDYKQFLDIIAKYTGRYVLIYITGRHLYLVTDATATRKAYYCKCKNRLWLASQPYLLAEVLGLRKTQNKSKNKYYNSEDFERLDHTNIGNTTYYDEIFQLIPNHYMDIKNFKIQRFWPDNRIEYRPYKEVAIECADIVKGYMEAIISRYKVMLPVTAGYDTRLLLAGTKDISEQVYYYINRDIGISDNNPDIRIPMKLFSKLKLDFHIIELSPDIDDEFKKIYFRNNPLASVNYLPHIYNYYMNFYDRVNLPGNIAAAPWGINQLAEKNVNPLTLANLYKLNDYEYAIEYYSNWLENCKQLCKECNMDVVRLFYWEERIANWGTQIQIDKDIAQEEINVFNSRLLLMNFLSVEKRYNNTPDKLLNKEIIRILWPKLLSLPINPSFLNSFKKFLASINMLGCLNQILYKNAR